MELALEATTRRRLEEAGAILHPTVRLEDLHKQPVEVDGRVFRDNGPSLLETFTSIIDAHPKQYANNNKGLLGRCKQSYALIGLDVTKPRGQVATRAQREAPKLIISASPIKTNLMQFFHE
jgi:hypothetical protein